MGCSISKKINQVKRKSRPRLESVVPTTQTETSSGYVTYSIPTEGYNITQGLHTYDSGNNLGLLCITNLNLIHQANTLARLEIPLANIINTKSRMCQMNFMTYPNDSVISLKCKIDESILCVNFKVDNPDNVLEEIERGRRQQCMAINNNTVRKSSSSSSRSSKLLMNYKP